MFRDMTTSTVVMLILYIVIGSIVDFVPVCGLDVGENFNLPKSENAKQPKCTPEKEEAIMQAFKHFDII